jgi:predicted alpha/beta-hydrolase family hydrolase
VTTDLLWTGPDGAPVLVLAHGAGAAMDSEWMNRMCALLGERGIRIARFEFAYMAARRGGTRKPPPRAESLLGEYRDVVAHIDGPVVIGGKSMGGRVASMVADELDAVAGLVCLGYPFHPPGAPERRRTAHLEVLQTPTLICQGTRDPFGTRDEVAGYTLAESIRILWLEDGEHELKPRTKLSGFTHVQHLATAADAVAAFALDRDRESDGRGVM